MRFHQLSKEKISEKLRRETLWSFDTTDPRQVFANTRHNEFWLHWAGSDTSVPTDEQHNNLRAVSVRLDPRESGIGSVKVSRRSLSTYLHPIGIVIPGGRWSRDLEESLSEETEHRRFADDEPDDSRRATSSRKVRAAKWNSISFELPHTPQRVSSSFDIFAVNLPFALWFERIRCRTASFDICPASLSENRPPRSSDVGHDRPLLWNSLDVETFVHRFESPGVTDRETSLWSTSY